MAGAFSDPGHLPKLRAGREPFDPYRLPRQRRGTTPQMHGRYPDFDVMAQAHHWDEATRRLIVDRVEHVPPIRFFGGDEARALSAFCDCLLAQDSEPRVPVLEMVDKKFAEGKLDGFRYAAMPDDPETWKRVAVGLDEQARARGAADFASAGEERQAEIIDAFANGDLEGGAFGDMPCELAWKVVTRGALSEFYSHPWTWNEIGFGGPAYPRGYVRIAPGQRESWEAEPALDLDPVADTQRRGIG
jgi:gluconate 2-dehydrogenase subunit 3-like protein